MVTKTGRISSGFSQRWSKFLIAGGALTLGSGMAQAGITYSGVLNQNLSSPTSSNIDFNGGGDDVKFTLTDTAISIEQVSANWYYVDDTGPAFSSFGATIDSGATYTSAPGNLISFSDPNWKGNYGKGNLNTAGYLGWRIDTGSGYKYGWVQLTANGTGSAGSTATTLLIKDFAYENVLDTSISAGDTGVSSVPEPSTFALLGAGIAGLAALRRRRKTTSQSDC